MLTKTQIALIRREFSELALDTDSFTSCFYVRLFRLAPELRSLFPADLGPQRKKLSAALAMVAGALDRPEVMLAAARAMGVRHVAYGASEAQLTTVGEALLGALQERLGDNFGDPSRKAWSLAFLLVADAMADGMRDAMTVAAANGPFSALHPA